MKYNAINFINYCCALRVQKPKFAPVKSKKQK